MPTSKPNVKAEVKHVVLLMCGMGHAANNSHIYIYIYKTHTHTHLHTHTHTHTHTKYKTT
jgi:hypothetical protein